MSNLARTFLRSLAVLLLPLVIGLSGSAAAVNVFPVCTDGAANTDVCQDVKSSSTSKTNPFIQFIKIAITVLAVIIGIAAVIVIIVSGLTFVSSGSDPQAVARARSGITYAIVGLAIAGLAESLVTFVLNKL